jgi:hypothetical protein
MILALYTAKEFLLELAFGGVKIEKDLPTATLEYF